MTPPANVVGDSGMTALTLNNVQSGNDRVLVTGVVVGINLGRPSV